MHTHGLELVFPTVVVYQDDPARVLYRGPLLQDWPELLQVVATLPQRENWYCTIFRPNYDERKHEVTQVEVYRSGDEWYFTKLFEAGFIQSYCRGPQQFIWYLERLAQVQIERGHLTRRSKHSASD